MNKSIQKAVRDDSVFCNHFLNIQLDFLLKLYYKTNDPIVGDYIVEKLEKVKKYRFWKIIRPIIVDKNLNFWRIKFNYTTNEIIDKKRRIFYLPSYYYKDDISYTFKHLRTSNIDKYTNFHLCKIEKFFTNEFNILYKNYINNRNKKYDLKKNEILKNIKDAHLLPSTFCILKRPRMSRIATINMNKKVVEKYKKHIEELSILIKKFRYTVYIEIFFILTSMISYFSSCNNFTTLETL